MMLTTPWQPQPELAKFKLWLDDVRPAPTGWDRAYGYDDFKLLIDLHGVPEFISFDHDLGFDRNGEKLLGLELKTGYDCAQYLISNDLGLPKYGWAVHSMNPVGSRNIHFVLNGYWRHLQQKMDL